MNALNGKIAIVTGGAGGIGGAQVEQFVAEGAKVVIAFLCSSDADMVTGSTLVVSSGA
ncbi:MAG: hypothetical protein ABI668_15510 [Sphingorhabdus sp.]